MKDKVISCRVQSCGDSEYILEYYMMDIYDAIASYETGQYAFEILYQDYRVNGYRLLELLMQKCEQNEYDFPYSGIPKISVENLNRFLESHYFKTRTYEASMSLIQHVNMLADRYYTSFHTHQFPNDFSGGSSSESWNETDRGSSSDYINQLLKKYDTELSEHPVEKVECLNVGQGNFSVGYNCSPSPCIVFDLGIQKSSCSYAHGVLNAVDDEGIVVISHYDEDHIRGVRFLNPAACDRLWILPELPQSPSDIARQLLNFLSKRNYRNCIFLPNVNYFLTPFDPAVHLLKIGNVEIYRGNAAPKHDPCQSTAENSRCLICLVSRNKSILLPADCLYQEFPVKFSVDYMMVPHHACNYRMPIDPAKIDLPKLRELIVCAGPYRRYRHPNKTHLIQLWGSGAKINLLIKYGLNYYFNDTAEINLEPFFIHPQNSKIICL